MQMPFLWVIFAAWRSHAAKITFLTRPVGAFEIATPGMKCPLIARFPHFSWSVYNTCCWPAPALLLEEDDDRSQD
jgi:hypothetical protein